MNTLTRAPEPGVGSRPVQLHVAHDLGGGAAKWLRDFALADEGRVNLVLRSYTHGPAAGMGLALYGHPLDDTPLRVWRLREPIEAAAAARAEYRAALAEVIGEFNVGAVLVSSLIGHSLDALDTGLPTLVVNHDYFPYCPAINLYYDAVCESCDGTRVAECHAGNARFNPFVGFAPAQRLQVRERFMELIARPGVTMVAPSESVASNLRRIDARFERVSFAIIAHGYHAPLASLGTPAPSSAERLRVLVLGQLSVAKGVELLEEAIPRLAEFAEIYFLGSGELGEKFRYEPHVHVTSRFEAADLPHHVANINPHVGVLASVVPETFSYALSELLMLGVPVAATRVGSFAERIRDGEDGFLFEPDAASLVAALRKIDTDRAGLARVRARIAGWKPRSAVEMVADYRRLLPMRDLEAGSEGIVRGVASPHAGNADPALAAETVTLASMWKDVKALNLQLAVVNEARHATEKAREHEERLRHEADERVAEHKKGMDERDALLIEKDRHIEHVTAQLNLRSAQLAELYASTSWRVSAPVRFAGRFTRKLRILARSLGAAVRRPSEIPGHVANLARAFRAGGLHEVKKTLVGLQPSEGYRDAWRDYRATFRHDVRPRIVEGVRAMAMKPLVSVIVPTYNTPEPMLRQMLDSVRAQLYPQWELCIADDGSSDPHVARVLKEYAAKDDRIRLHLGNVNRGVSNASNRALEMARGDFVVLLDHDDLLEEQALFRVAESIVADDPDMLYSDEVLVTPDASAVRRYAYRPAFSLEYLRSHPYIVHLVGFRKRLLDEIGGFDEGLRISQDYDLVLRAAEKARTIVHIPEILYQWRLHASSAGTQKMETVMETSKGVLRRHLERSGEQGTVASGASFNLFDVRYGLREGLRVAIVIPTKNHGELLRQCVESIRATVKEVAYDIVVVDHESDDPQTVAYLASIAGEVRVLRHEGPFNFSEINNRAVAQLGSGYTHYLFCNNDIEAIEPGWLERMLELGQQPSVGIVGAQLLYPDRKSIQHAGVCVGAYGAAEHYAKRLRFPGDPIEPGFAELLMLNHEVSAVTAACMLIRKDAFDAVGGFDESIAVGFGDVDLCLRVLGRGYRIVYCPFATLVHHESFTRGTSTQDPHPEDSRLYRLKWKAMLDAGDPFHHPGLSLTSSNWALKSPLACGFEIRRRIVTREPSGRERVSFS